MLTEEFHIEICKFKDTYSKSYAVFSRRAPNFIAGLETLFVSLDAKYYDTKNQLQQAQVLITRHKAQIAELQRQIGQAQASAIDEYPKLIARKIRAQQHVNLTDNEAKVLYWIQNSPEALIVHQLARHCNIPITTCHGVINSLERKRLIKTKKCGRSKKCYALQPKKVKDTTENTSVSVSVRNDETINKEGTQ